MDQSYILCLSTVPIILINTPVRFLGKYIFIVTLSFLPHIFSQWTNLPLKIQRSQHLLYGRAHYFPGFTVNSAHWFIPE